MKRSDFKLEPELKGMKVADIKKHVRAFNKHYAIQGYSKLKKAGLVSAILSAQMRLGGAKKTKKKLVVVEEPKKASPVLTEFYFDERPYLKDADDNIYDRKTRKKISTLAILKKKLAEHTAERRRLFEIRQKEKAKSNKGKKKQKSQTLEEVKANLAKSNMTKMFKAADEMIAEKKLSYAEATKIKSYGRSYFSWSNETIPITLWEQSSGRSGDPSPKELQKFTKSSLAKYRKVFQSRHGSEMKTEDEWKKTWRDFADEIRNLVTGKK